MQHASWRDQIIKVVVVAQGREYKKQEEWKQVKDICTTLSRGTRGTHYFSASSFIFKTGSKILRHIFSLINVMPTEAHFARQVVQTQKKSREGKKKDHQQVSINFPANCCNDSNYEGRRWAGQHMQYIKAERTLKPKASETIKTIITSDKFIARTHTRTPTT